jgi:hypothetical protein
VAEAHGLRGLEVREPGHEQADVLLGHVGHGDDELGQQLHDLLHLPAQVQPHVRRHLVVPAAACGAERTGRTQALGSQSYAPYHCSQGGMGSNPAPMNKSF